jgi:hypothetical protein
MLGMLVGVTTFSTSVPSASALPVLEALGPVTKMLGLDRDRNHTFAVPTEVGKGNANGNTFNINLSGLLPRPRPMPPMYGPGPMGLPPQGAVPTGYPAPPPQLPPAPVPSPY